MTPEKELGWHLRAFLGEHLPKQRGASPRTVKAYRDAFKLLLRHVAGLRKCSVADLRLEHIDRTTVLGFLTSIETERSNSTATRNHRLAAIRSFFRFVSSNAPEVLEHCAQIVAIPMKRADSRSIDYLTVEEVRAILAQVGEGGFEAQRDDVLLRFLYNTGARVQEALDVRANDFELGTPAHVLLRGKGRKERVCPLWADTVRRLRRLLADRGIDTTLESPLFTNRDGKSLTRSGVRYILAKYARAATPDCLSLQRKKIHPHTLRHTTAMHLLQSGVDLNTIRCWLGHANIATTNRYVEIDLEMKRRALEGVSAPAQRSRPAIADAELLTWLESL